MVIAGIAADPKQADALKTWGRPHEIFASKQQEIVKTDSLSVMVVK